MAISPMFLGAYWNSREEDRQSCATRISSFLRMIGSGDRSLETWLLKGPSMQGSQQRMELTSDAIASVLKANNRDSDSHVIAELGFRASFWNGKNASFSATLGSFSPYVGNAVVLSFDDQAPSEKRIWRFLIEKAIETFDPDSAVVTNHDYISRHGGGLPSDAGGWFAYRRKSEIVESEFP